MPYIHAKIKEKNIVGEIILTLLPLVLYGCYKNGYLVYQKGYISFWLVFKPLILFGSSFLLYELYYLIKNHRLGFDYGILAYLVLSMCVSPLLNIYGYLLIMGLFLLIDKIILKKITFNRTAFLKICFVFLMIYQQSYSYANLYEQKTNFAFNYFDLLIGHQIGGIAVTSVIIGLIAYFLLAYRKNIKSIIFPLSYCLYFLLSLSIMLYTNNFNFTNLFNANVLFALIFVATDNLSSPNTKIGLIFYSGLIGIFTVLFSYLFNYYDGIYLAIFLISLGGNTYDKLTNLRIFTKNNRKNKGNRI